ncbi:MAG: PAS domain S-box protein, partial [Rubrivivax sp.]|nr:PAS domain S-box protein [Rubrivivax sp.]
MTRTPVPAAARLLEQLADAVYLLDPETSNIVWGNRSAWESLGLTAEQVLDHSVLSLQMDVTGAPQWSDIAAVIRSVPCYTFVGRHRHAAGHEVAVEVNTTRFFDEGREYFLSVARDISRRLALEGDLRKRENQLWFALNEATDGLWDWDTVTNDVFFSPLLKRMLGYGPDEMPPELTTWSRNIHPEDASRVMGLLRDHLEGRRTRYEAEYRLRTRNGSYLWVMDRGRVCERDAAGAPTRVVGMVQDITKEREARDALRRSEEEQRTLIAALPDIVMRLDRHGRHLYVSENIGTLVPMTPADIVGRTHRELGFPDALCRFWDEAIRDVFDSGRPHESEFEMAGREGPCCISWRIVPDRDPASGVRTVLVVCRDVTERRRAEAELQRHRHHLEDLVVERTAALSEAKAAAEAANHAKSRFLAHMSHELRTPMSAIIGMTDLARQRAADPLLREQLGKVEQASHHLLRVINDILDLSRIEAERMVLEQVRFRPATVFASVESLAGHRAQEKGLAFSLVMAPALASQALLGDPLRLKQVVLNLVDNAIKFTEGGQVSVHVTQSPAGPEAVLLGVEVRDTGIGIAPEARERLFMPFEQADNSTTRRYGGSGLGLAISRQLVRMMGGNLELDTEPGRGSCFRFSVPLRLGGDGDEENSATQSEAVLRALQHHHAGRRVLVAEDDPVSSEISVVLLRRAGLEVDVAADGETAAAMAASQRYDLVLMDMQMP